MSDSISFHFSSSPPFHAIARSAEEKVSQGGEVSLQGSCHPPTTPTATPTPQGTAGQVQAAGETDGGGPLSAASQLPEEAAEFPAEDSGPDPVQEKWHHQAGRSVDLV